MASLRQNPMSLSPLLFSTLLLSGLTHAQSSDNGGDNGPLGSGAIPSSQQTNSVLNNNPDPDSSTEDRTLYWIILVVVAVLLICVLVLVLLRRRRRAILASSRARVSRDLEAQRMQRGLTAWRTNGTNDTSVTIHMNNTPASQQPQRSSFFSYGRHRNQPVREEGLDENGEAPPPYEPRAQEKEEDKDLNVARAAARRDSDATTRVGSPTSPAHPPSRTQQAPSYEDVTRPSPTHAR